MVPLVTKSLLPFSIEPIPHLPRRERRREGFREPQRHLDTLQLSCTEILELVESAMAWSLFTASAISKVKLGVMYNIRVDVNVK